MTADDHLLNAPRLHLIPGVGPRTTELLLEAFGSATRVLAATEAELISVDGVGPKLARAIQSARGSDDAARELDRCRQIGATLYARGTPGYPHLLSTIPDAPAVLYCQG